MPYLSLELMGQHRSRLALQAMNVIPADPEDQIPVVHHKRKRNTTGVIVIDGSDDEEEGLQGNESSDSETDEMERRMAELEVSISIDTTSADRSRES